MIPARDESRRIAGVLAATVGARGVTEVIVVDDESSDDTAAVARAAGAVVVAGASRPHGWAGKPWAMQQGVEAATSTWVVTLDADTRPDPTLPAALVARCIEDGTDLLTVGGRFDCPTPGATWMHAAMLTTLVYRFGAPGAAVRPVPDRMMANGQCMAFRRRTMLDADGFQAVAGHVVEDIALARRVSAAGWNVDFLDASELLSVRMYESLGDTWTGWGRSIGLPGVEPRRRQLLDLALLSVVQALPLPRLVARRGDLLDVVLILLRLGTLAGTRRSYVRGGWGYWASPVADLPATIGVALSMFRSRQSWRGRWYETPARPARNAVR